jgi:antitoxin component YwqK of YwqJK toxin-antitoxin module
VNKTPGNEDKLIDSQQFKKNITRWSLFHQAEANLLSNLKCQRVAFQKNDQGNLNLTVILNNVLHDVHSRHNPLKEAKDQFNTLNLKNIDVIYIFGVGLGYLYEAAKEWLHHSPDHFLVFLENDLEVIYHFLQTERGTEVLFDRQVWLTYVDPQGKEIDSIVRKFLLKRTAFLSLGFYDKEHKAEAASLQSKLSFYQHLRTGIAAEGSSYGRRFYDNYYRNLLKLPQAHFGNALFGKFKDIPAIICGAGPSLAKQLPLLKNLKENALIFAGATAMNALNTEGVLPHFGVGIDPNPAQFTRLIMNQAYETPYFYRNRMNYRALNVIHGPRLYVMGSSGYEISRYFEEKFGMEGVNLSEGFNVINFSLSIAHAMGCNPIVFVGLDLAYTNSLSYCPGIFNHPLHDRREHFGTKTVDEELINKADYQGKPTLTLWKWISESAWFTNFSRYNPQTLFYNATEGGLGFVGILNISLEACAKSFLTKQFDLSARVHGEIEQAAFPTGINDSMVIQSIRDLLDSLKRCQESCKLIVANFDAAKPSIEDLNNESAYKWILQDSNQSYEEIFKRDFQRLKVDQELLGEKDYQTKKNSLEVGRYQFLSEAATANIRIIEPILKAHIEDFQKVLRPSKEGKSSKQLEIMPEEQCVPFNGTQIRKESYPDGRIKIEQYDLEDKLHGPSTYYSKEGNVLSRHWFLNGLQQGKASKYYQNGALASIQQFSDGQWDGRQEYYYPQGKIKTILNYSKGLLHGAVQLFYPNGQLQRELNFVEGKRHGHDSLWNELGLMVITAEFDHDRAIGTARQWYENGNIAKEVEFFPETQEYVEREWRENGAMRVVHKGIQGDYFDHVSLQTQKLTKTLENLSDQVQSIVPVIDEVSNLKMPPELLDSLKKELVHLGEINKKLLFETGLDQTNEQESIWKTPTLKLEVEEQIEKLSSMMTKEMGNLQKNLKTTLEKLGKKIDQKTKQKDSAKDDKK